MCNFRWHLPFQAISELVSSAITNWQPVIYGFRIIEFLAVIYFEQEILHMFPEEWSKKKKTGETPGSETVFANCALNQMVLKMLSLTFWNMFAKEALNNFWK